MTDNEIIKALECCNYNHTWQKECFNCEYATFESNCGTELIKDALDLITRQKAEIEGWKEAFNNLDKIARPSVEYVKSEKIKTVDEFARRLIEEIDAINYKEYNNYLDTLDIIERVAEEMECETNEMQNTEAD